MPSPKMAPAPSSLSPPRSRSLPPARSLPGARPQAPPPLRELLRARAAARGRGGGPAAGGGSAMAAAAAPGMEAEEEAAAVPVPGSRSPPRHGSTRLAAAAASWWGAALRLALAVLLHAAQAEKEGERPSALPHPPQPSVGAVGAVVCWALPPAPCCCGGCPLNAARGGQKRAGGRRPAGSEPGRAGGRGKGEEGEGERKGRGVKREKRQAAPRPGQPRGWGEAGIALPASCCTERGLGGGEEAELEGHGVGDGKDCPNSASGVSHGEPNSAGTSTGTDTEPFPSLKDVSVQGIPH